MEVGARFCENCGATGASRVCSKCKAAYYCNRECQRAAWKKGHKSKCVAADDASTPAPEPAIVSRPAPVHGGGGSGGAGAGSSSDWGECAICLEAYRDPVTMPCAHRFCRKCIADSCWISAGKTFVFGDTSHRCPLCRAAIPSLDQKVDTGLTLLISEQAWRNEHPQQDPPAKVRRLFKEGFRILAAAIKDDPGHAVGQYYLSLCHVREREPDAAINALVCCVGSGAAYEWAENEHIRAKAHYNLADALWKSRGDNVGAEKHFRRAIALNPGYANALCSLGQILVRRRSCEEAEVMLRRSYALDPSPIHSQSLGWLLLSLSKDFVFAESVIRHGLVALGGVTPPGRETLHADLWFDLGRLLVVRFPCSANARAEAGVAFGRAAKLDPGSTDVADWRQRLERVVLATAAAGKDACAVCGKEPNAELQLLRCAKCKMFKYCSKAHQLEHWTKGGHKKLCHDERGVRFVHGGCGGGIG